MLTGLLLYFLLPLLLPLAMLCNRQLINAVYVLTRRFYSHQCNYNQPCNLYFYRELLTYHPNLKHNDVDSSIIHSCPSTDTSNHFAIILEITPAVVVVVDDLMMQAANAHVGHVKEFHSPAAPKAPVVPTGADLAKEIEAYEREVSFLIHLHTCRPLGAIV